MKAKELMIGDWVIYRGKPTIVYEIDDYYQRINTEPDGYDSIKCIDISEIEFIPITTEILEKNGWTYNDEDEKFSPQTWVGGGLMLQDGYEGGYRIVVTSDYDDEDTNNTPFFILYVHELQHALRLRRIEKEIVL